MQYYFPLTLKTETETRTHVNVYLYYNVKTLQLSFTRAARRYDVIIIILYMYNNY